MVGYLLAAVAAVLVLAGFVASRGLGEVPESVQNAPLPPALQSGVASTEVAPVRQHLNALPVGKAVVATLGSSLTAGNGASEYSRTWAWQIRGALATDTRDVDLREHGLPGRTVEAIRKEGLDATIADQPSVVFFEPGTPNNLGQGLTVADARDLTAQTVADLRAALPQAYIVGIIPSPTTTGETGAGGATIQDYLAGDREALAGADIVCDVAAAFPNDEGALALLIPDGVHPGDEGNALWAQTIKGCLGI